MKQFILGLTIGLAFALLLVLNERNRDMTNVYPILWDTGDITCEHIPVSEIEWSRNELN